LENITLSNGKVVKMKVPIIKDLRAVAIFTDKVEKELNLIQNLTELTADEIDLLPIEDYKILQHHLNSILL